MKATTKSPDISQEKNVSAELLLLTLGTCGCWRHIW